MYILAGMCLADVGDIFFFQEAGVTIIDHHSCSDSFLKHVENEVSTEPLLLTMIRFVLGANMEIDCVKCCQA